MDSQRRRIVFLNRSYWPDIEATGQLLTDLCEGLAGRFDVHVVCGQPNSPEPDSEFVSAGVQLRNGVTIHRLRHRQFQKKNSWGRILNLLSFYNAAKRFLNRCDLGFDIVISETDPFLLPLAGQAYARRNNARHCVYLQDVYPDVAEAVGKLSSKPVASAIRRKLRSAYQQASKVVVLGRCMRDRLIESPWGLAAERIEIIPNWADCDAIKPLDSDGNEFRKRYCGDDDFVVMHSGNMGLTQRLEVLISAAADPAWPSRAKLLLVGNGASRDMLLAHAERLRLPAGRLRFVNYQPRHKLAESLSAADIHVVSMHEKVTGCLCPSKLYGIMAAGRPVIAIADSRTDLCQTVIEREIGWVVPPGSPAQIAGAVARAEAASRQPNGYAGYLRRQRARSVATLCFDRPVIIARFAAMFERLFSETATGVSEHELAERERLEPVDAAGSRIAVSK